MVWNDTDKIFLNQELAKLEQDINLWLKEHYNNIQVVDVKYQSIGNKYLSFFAFSAMVIYEKKE